MTHEAFQTLLTAYLEGSLSPADRSAMDDHLRQCSDCALHLAIRQDCQRLDDDSEVPALFTSSWQLAIRQQEEENMQTDQKEKKERKPLRFRPWMAAAAALVIVLGGTLAIRRPTPMDTQSQYDQLSAAYPSEPLAKSASGSFSGTGTNIPEARYTDSALEAAPAPGMNAAETPAKIIRTISLAMVSRAFDKDLENLNTALKDHGGYVEYSDIAADRGSRRYANLTLRVPKVSLDAFLERARGFGRTLSMTESQEDVSEQYRDIDMRLATQKTKMDRLQELLLKALTVTDVLSIEREIADTQYKIDSLTGSLRGMDSKVDYSTVTISLAEESVAAITPDQSLLDRIGIAIADAWRQVKAFLADTAVFLTVTLPYALALFILIFAIRKIFRRKMK